MKYETSQVRSDNDDQEPPDTNEYIYNREQYMNY